MEVIDAEWTEELLGDEPGEPESALAEAPSLPGRRAAWGPPVYVRDLTESDLLTLATAAGPAGRNRSKWQPTIREVGERHRLAARLVAQGLSDAEIAAITGYATGSIRVYKSDPAFKELVAHYRNENNAGLADTKARLEALAADAVSAIHRDLEDDPSKVTMSQKLAIAQLALDRTGHSPTAKAVVVHTTGPKVIEAVKAEVSQAQRGRVRVSGG